jgi:hypothetical protein
MQEKQTVIQQNNFMVELNKDSYRVLVFIVLQLKVQQG